MFIIKTLFLKKLKEEKWWTVKHLTVAATEPMLASMLLLMTNMVMNIKF